MRQVAVISDWVKESAGRTSPAQLVWEKEMILRVLMVGLALAAGLSTARAQQASRAEAVTNPSLGMGLSGIADWSSQQPFLDVLKSARPWIGHTPEEWGAWSNEQLAQGGFLSPEGWPRALPPGVDRLETLVLTDLPEEARSLAGVYVLSWEGNAEVSVSGRAQELSRDERSLTFSYEPGEGLVGVAVTRLDPEDPLRGMTLVRQDRQELLEAGAVFNPDFLARIQNFRALRFMDWMMTNNSPQVSWEDRPQIEDASWMQRGVPMEIMVQLANEVGADPWFTLPHAADDAYVADFATYVRDHLDPELKVYAEWSNEAWNFLFSQAKWAEEQASARWGVAPGGDAWVQFAGLRAAEVADIWGSVFGAEAEERLVRVVSMHTEWLGLEQALLLAPLAVAEGRAPPVASFDAYGVTGYFDHGISSEELAPQLRRWIASGSAAEEVTPLASAEIQELVDEVLPYHAEVARQWDLQLVAYEGGTHIVGQGPVVDDDAITGFYTSYSYSQEMADLYRQLLDGWRANGGTLFMAFVDTAMPSKWGSWGALRHLDDANPRWDALVAANAVPPDWEEREPDTFDQGIQRFGTPGTDTLDGTPEEDDLLGFAGDDRLVGHGGSDRLHGGGGRDRAVLPGAAEDWTQDELQGAVLLRRDREEVRLTAVEEVEFEGTGEVLTLNPKP